MDFVDLDKVLDQFEEEEKAAEEIMPGQEIKPSGYAEYLVSHQDRPWDSLSLGQPVDASSRQLHLHPQSVTYDDPYNSLDRSALGGFRQLGFPSKTSYIEHQADTDSLGHSHSLEQELAQAKLKEEKIEIYLPTLHLSNGVGQGSGLDVNGWVDGGKADDGERRGLIASQPASIQTDVLSPASEKELLSYPLPKSDILVEGHGHPSRASESTSCPSAEAQPSTIYASSNGIIAPPASTQHLSQDTEVKSYLIDEMGSFQTSHYQEMERDKVLLSDTEAGSHMHETQPLLASAQATVDLEPPEKPVDKQGTDISLQDELADSVKKGGEDRPVEKAIGFGSEECDMDRDEVDAYLQELESMLTDNGDLMEKAAEDSTGDSVQDTDTTAATVQSFADSGGDASVMAQTNHTSADNIAGHGEGADNQTEDTIRCEDSSGHANLHGVTDHRAAGEDTGVSASTNTAVFRDERADVQHQGVETGRAGQTEAPVRTDMQQHCGLDTEDEHGDNQVNTGGLADNTPLKISDVNKTEVSLGTCMNRLVDTTSLEFPVAANKIGVSSIAKGKLEIEGLLDEIVGARLAQKSTKLVSADEGSPGRGSVEQTSPRDIEGSEKSRMEGWGSEGSMVCSLVRETSPEVTSPAQSGSPSPTLGIGARPKDPSQMKKNRPNSLLGLSKISLASPFSPPQQTVVPVIDVMLPTHHQPPEIGREGRTHMGMRQLGMSSPPDSSAVMPMDGTPAPSDMDCMMDEGVESPMMRRSEVGGMIGDGEEASNGMLRPQSWSPSSLSSPPSQRTKRPTSLNLPVQQDRMGSLSPDADGSRTRKVGMVAESGGSSEAGSSEEESMAMGVGGTDGCTYGDISRGDPQQEQEGAGAAAELPLEAPPPSILHLNLGKIAPTWLPDADATCCMECAARFTFTKRRHHCRACGKIFCSTCCGQKSRLTYLENKEGRVCVACHHILSSAHCVRPAGVSCRSPNPNNPIEYCSTVPPTQQANARAPLPTVMVPTGVLKRHGSNRKSEPKQVIFSDGIRPGGDLTELDGSDQARIPPRRSGRPQKKVEKQQGEHSSAKTRRLRGSDGLRNPCLIPDEGLPPIVVHTDDKGEVSLSEIKDPASIMAQIRNEEASPVIFAINLNLFVQVKIINLDCCVKRVVWCFTTQGMVTVGQEELVMVLETLPDEDTVPRDIFCHLSTVYQEAGKGNTVSHMGHSIFNQAFLDSGSHGGFLYLRATFQCTSKLILPQPPFLFPILLHKWETPWAKVFPIRLMLRLGAEHRYYPCPLVSIRNRKPVFFEIGHTIMNLLADFRNFQYMLQQIRGVSIHMEDQKTFINFPRNRYQEVMKVVSSSNEHVMALGASFSLEADSHLVCIQNEDGNYQTQAINIQNKPRQVTGASFVVFNGALKTSAGLRAKSSIVEDGLMVQILPETMGALKQSLKDMKDFVIPCGSLSLPEPEEVVTIRWVEDDKNINLGVKSPVDGMSLEGVENVPVHNATDYVGERLAIRWTQLFFLQTESGMSRWEPVDLSRVAETLANAVCIALTPHLQKLKEAGLTKIGLRVTLQPDSVGYEVGSKGERLPDFYINDLDNALIPVIHGAITANQEGPIVLELHLYLIH